MFPPPNLVKLGCSAGTSMFRFHEEAGTRTLRQRAVVLEFQAPTLSAAEVQESRHLTRRARRDRETPLSQETGACRVVQDGVNSNKV